MKKNYDLFIPYCESNGLPAPVAEYQFQPLRKWRMDFAFPEKKIYIEIDGGIWVTGGHNRGAQMLKDWEKQNTAASMGWRLLKCQPKDLYKSEMLAWMRGCLL